MSSNKNELMFIPGNGALWPGEEDAELLMRKLKPGVGIYLMHRQPRNPQHHKRLMALINLVLKSTERWANKDVLRHDLKMATGLYKIRVNQITGLTDLVADPIDFAAMPQTLFEAWYPKAVDKLADALGCTPDELEGMLEKRPQEGGMKNGLEEEKMQTEEQFQKASAEAKQLVEQVGPMFGGHPIGVIGLSLIYLVRIYLDVANEGEARFVGLTLADMFNAYEDKSEESLH